MEIHLIGHASIFVRTQDCRILMDPVLFDPFYEGNNEVCPQREVIYEQIPEFDVLVISHKHRDHFDIRSLAYLPKTVDVLIPKDKLIENSLRKLGYSQIYSLKDFTEVKMGSTTLWTTRSENRVPEFGMIFADDSGIFWNQVDTDASVDTISSVLSRYQQIDFLLANWQPMLEWRYQLNESISFPYSSYNQKIYTISLIQPRAIAPGANGFRYINGSSWLNQIVFPVTPERFCQDVQYIWPELGQNVFALDPGDVLTFGDGEFSHLPEKCEFVRKVADNRDSLAFAPVKVGAELKDYNPHGHAIEFLKQEIEQEICFNLTNFISKNLNTLFREHRKWKVIYQLEVTFPDESSQKWVFDFSEKQVKPRQEYNPLANFFTYITASGIYDFLKGTVGLSYVVDGGYYRSYHKVYLVTQLGIITPASLRVDLQDPLKLRLFPSHLNSDSDSVVEREIEIWRSLVDIN